MHLDARIDRDLVLSFLGHRGQLLDDELEARIDDAIEACERELKPRGIYREFEIERSRSAVEKSCDPGGTFSMENSRAGANIASSATSAAPAVPAPFVTLAGCGLVLSGHDIVRHLAGASAVVLMACTLGLESERFLRLGRARGVTDGLLCDAAASAYVEDAAEALNRLIADDARQRGLRAGTRFSPGYGDLPLAVQPAFVDVLDAGKLLGLSVTEANLMIPTKSITAVIGVFDAPEGSCAVYPAV